MPSPIVAAGRWASRPFERPAATGDAADRDTIQDLLREGELEGVGEREEMAIITRRHAVRREDACATS